MTWEVEHIGPHTLILGDCREVLPTLAGVDAVITDPPYGTNFKAAPPRKRSTSRSGRVYDTGYAGQAMTGNNEKFDPFPWLALAPFCLFWGAQYFADCLPPRASWLVWDKRVNPLFYGYMSFADCELAWCSDNKPARMYQQIWNGLVRQGEESTQPRVHPTQKPLALMRWCVNKTSGHVLDPFMGSGTTGVACVQLGRLFTGIEIERQYFDLACERMHAAMVQPDLFIDHAPRAIQQPLFAGGA